MIGQQKASQLACSNILMSDFDKEEERKIRSSMMHIL